MLPASLPADGGFLLLDGGTGRELLRLGAPFRQPEWSALALMLAPEFVTQVHRRYIEAGADVITTNSYAVVPFHIGAERFESDGPDLAALAGKLARAAADEASRKVLVAGSLPPVCGSYRPDLFDPAVARPVLEKLLQALDPNVDLWLSETISSTAEMVLMSEVLAEAQQPPDAHRPFGGQRPGDFQQRSNVQRPWWISYTLEDEPTRASGPRLRSGEPVAPAVAHAAKLGAGAILFNCCQPEVISDAILAARQALTDDRVLIGAYANGFGPQSKQARANSQMSHLRVDLGPAEYLAWIQRWRGNGARILGGCCGVGPEHIALIREALA